MSTQDANDEPAHQHLGRIEMQSVSRSMQTDDCSVQNNNIPVQNQTTVFYLREITLKLELKLQLYSKNIQEILCMYKSRCTSLHINSTCTVNDHALFVICCTVVTQCFLNHTTLHFASCVKEDNYSIFQE